MLLVKRSRWDLTPHISYNLGFNTVTRTLFYSKGWYDRMVRWSHCIPKRWKRMVTMHRGGRLGPRLTFARVLNGWLHAGWGCVWGIYLWRRINCHRCKVLLNELRHQLTCSPAPWHYFKIHASMINQKVAFRLWSVLYLPQHVVECEKRHTGWLWFSSSSCPLPLPQW